VFSKLEIAYFDGKILSISLKLNFAPNTLGCYGLILSIITTVDVEIVHGDNGQHENGPYKK